MVAVAPFRNDDPYPPVTIKRVLVSLRYLLDSEGLRAGAFASGEELLVAGPPAASNCSISPTERTSSSSSSAVAPMSEPYGPGIDRRQPLERCRTR
jgi:hypothetical protein